jgi:hypothetical protein
MATRVTPATGTDRQRLATAAAGKFLASEAHTTSDHGRAWMGGTRPLTGAVYLGAVASQAAMLALHVSGAKGRGCFEGDDCYRSDTLTWWKCIANNGKLIGEWQEITAPSSGSVTAASVSYSHVASGLTAIDVQAAIDELKTLIPAPFSGNAVDVSYDHTTSSLTATDVQAALDEIVTMIGGGGGGGTGDVVGPSPATDNAAARFDTSTGKLIQNSLLIIDDSGNISSGGTLPSNTAAYFKRSGYSILTVESTGQDARMRMIRPDNSKGAMMEFIRGATDEWYMGTPYTAATPDGSGNQFVFNYYDGTDHTFFAITAAGVLSFPAYTTAGFLQVNSSGVVSVGTPTAAAAGSAGYVQYNSSGSMAASNGFIWDNSNKLLKLGFGSDDVALYINGGAGGPPYIAFAISGTFHGSFGVAAATNQFFTGAVNQQFVIKSDSGHGVAMSGNGSSKQFELLSSGAVELVSSIKTGAPSSGTAAAWKLGSKATAGVTPDLTGYIELDIGGTLYKLALVT